MKAQDPDTDYQHTTQLPPDDLSFSELFDFFWARGLGNTQHTDGTSIPWTAASLETALDGSPDKRSIENWRSQSNMPSPENIRKLSWVIAGDNKPVRTAWYEALIAARLSAKRSEQAAQRPAPEKHLTQALENTASQHSNTKTIWGGIGAIAVLVAGLFWWWIGTASSPAVSNMRICDAPYFDDELKDCTQHVSVFVHGIDEVFLSFDFGDVEDGTPFDRWWILEGERVAGRTSFNDEAWPGYTYWRPGVLEVGQYVVRIVVNGEVFTQTFYVQPEGFLPEE